MAKIIATNTERMQIDISNYSKQVQAVDRALKEAWSAIEELNASWSGPAHDTLVEQFRADREVVEQLIVNLRNNQEELEIARREFETCEKEVNSMIKSMKV